MFIDGWVPPGVPKPLAEPRTLSLAPRTVCPSNPAFKVMTGKLCF